MHPSCADVNRRPAANRPRAGFSAWPLLVTGVALVATVPVLPGAFPEMNGFQASSWAADTAPRLRDAIANLSLLLETTMIEAYDHAFHDADDQPPIIDIFPGLDRHDTIDRMPQSVLEQP